RRQLLTNAVVQVVPDAALLSIADLQDLPFQPPAFSDVASDAFDLHDAPVLRDQPRADFQFDALPGGVDEIPFRVGHVGALNDLVEPLAGGGAMIFGHQLDEIL